MRIRRWICPGFTILLVCGLLDAKTVVQKDVEFDVSYHDTVTSEIQTIYAFSHTFSRNKTEGVRVTVDVQTQSSKDPMLFVVRQKQAVLSFQVPLVIEGLHQREYLFNHIGRTLCQPPTASETQDFFVDVSTLSSRGTNYEFRVSLLESFTLQTDQKLNITASPSQPQYFKYVFPESVNTVIVKVTSDMAFPCSFLSVQDIQCPVYDLDTNVDNSEKYQTITKKGAITVQREDFPSASFYVVVVVKAEDKACGGPDELIDAENRTKILDVVVSPVVYDKDSVHNITVGLCAMIVGIAFGIFIVACCITRVGISWAQCCNVLITPSLWCSGWLESKRKRRGEVFIRQIQTWAPVPQPGNTDALSMSDFNGANEAPVQNCERDMTQDEAYPWNIATISVFYALPVIQLVIAHQKAVHVSGNQDICYYNFLCARPLWGLSSFNNILSNVGYVLLGMIFIAIVLRRDIRHNKALQRSETESEMISSCTDREQITEGCRIPKYYGLFYAMGMTLIMEGVLSACYHICPNYENFQFDTSFMYMIAGLCMLKLYQKRHPDITASASTAYFCLAIVVFFSVIGVVCEDGSWFFWIVFSLVHVLAALLLSIHLYYAGRCRLAWQSLWECSGPMHNAQFFFFVLGNLANWILVIVGLVKRPTDFDSHLLIVAILNLLLYLVFCIYMKCRSGESIHWLVWVLIFFTVPFWISAICFFKQGLTTWEKTPAESREGNKDCVLWSYFDDHDIWHFLSSVALFGSFLILLILDDDG